MITSTQATRTAPRNRISGSPISQTSPAANVSGKANRNGSAKSRKSDASGPSLPSAAEIELAVQRYEQLKTEAKAAYAEADRIFETVLLSGIGVGGKLVLSDGRTAAVVDNFVDKTGQPKLTAYKPCGVKRYDFECK